MNKPVAFLIFYLTGLLLLPLSSSIHTENAVAQPLIQFIGILMMIGSATLLVITTITQATPQRPQNLPAAGSDIEYAINQLSKNYDITRIQTTYGFTMSIGFILLGFLAIVVGATAERFGITKESGTVTTIAGVITDFISATALWIYRANFVRLNKTCDELNQTWKILAALRELDKQPRIAERNRLKEDLLRQLGGLPISTNLKN
jgi:hypothetical protein